MVDDLGRDGADQLADRLGVGQVDRTPLAAAVGDRAAARDPDDLVAGLGARRARGSRLRTPTRR